MADEAVDRAAKAHSTVFHLKMRVSPSHSPRTMKRYCKFSIASRVRIFSWSGALDRVPPQDAGQSESFSPTAAASASESE